MDLFARNRLIGELIDLLAKGDYVALLRRAPHSRLNAEQLAAAVEAYGGQIVPLPPSGYRLINSLPVSGSIPPAWSIVVPLFTKEEGRSDLSMELTVAQAQDGGCVAQIDDVHVL
jgi:hypothetical protein